MKTSDIIFDYYSKKPSLYQTLSEVKIEESELVQSIKFLLDAIHHSKLTIDYSLIFNQTKTFEEQEHEKDLGLHFLYYYACCAYISFESNVNGASEKKYQKILTIYKRAKNLGEFSEHPSFRFLSSSLDGILSLFEENLIKREKILYQLTQALDPNSILYCSATYQYLFSLFQSYNFPEFIKTLESIKDKQDNPYFKSIYRFFEFNINCGLTTEFDKTDVSTLQAIMNHDIPTLEKLGLCKKSLFNVVGSSLRLLQFNGGSISQSLINQYPFAQLAEDYWSCLKLLAQEKPKESFELMKENINLKAGQYNYLLIRLHLANARPKTAYSLLKKKIDKFGINCFDEFHLARYYLLKNEKRQAAIHFQNSFDYFKENGFSNYLETEIKLSCELKPIDIFSLINNLPKTNTRSLVQSVKQNPRQHDDQNPLDQLIGSGPWHKEIVAKINKYCMLDKTILIKGETGTGKDIVARALHNLSPQCNQPFLSINCGALHENLLETELFGHAKGAFTGAEQVHEGLLSQAGEGTLFLDEISDMAPKIQIALLRVLENREFRPVGSSQTQKVSCRIICATNTDLRDAYIKGSFRQDLYFRLTSLTIDLPPLRERKHDIKRLAHHFLSQDRDDPITLSSQLVKCLTEHSWPGNIRELRNEIEYIKLTNQDKNYFDSDDLKPEFLQSFLEKKAKQSGGLTFKNEEALKNIEEIKQLFSYKNRLTRMEICKTLKISHTTAAKYLKILCQENIIKKITPSGSTRFNYFVHLKKVLEK